MTKVHIASLVRDDQVYLLAAGTTQALAIASANEWIATLHDDLKKSEPTHFEDVDASVLRALPTDAEDGQEFEILGVGEVRLCLDGVELKTNDTQQQAAPPPRMTRLEKAFCEAVEQKVKQDYGHDDGGDLCFNLIEAGRINTSYSVSTAAFIVAQHIGQA